MKRKDPKPHTRSPQVWGGYKDGVLVRIRMLYPDGQSDWDAGTNHYPHYPFSRWTHCPERELTPCWQPCERMKSFSARVRLMKAYDKSEGQETCFLGNV